MSCPDLSVVVASYNTRDLLRNCLRTVFDTTAGIELEVIVVDDCSPDDSCAMVEAEFPNVRLIRNPENVRYAKTNNAGLRAAQGRYGLLLNSDTEVQPDAFRTLVEFMDSHPEAAAAGPKLINPDGSIQHCVRSFTGLWPMVFQTLNLHLVWPNNPFTRPYYNTHLDPDEPTRVQSIGTTAFIIRRSTWEEVGMLDERFTLAFVDLAYCHRLAASDKPVYYVPHAVVLHFGSQSINQNGVREIYLQHSALRLFYDHYVGVRHGPIKRVAVHGCIAIRKWLKALEFRLSRDKRVLKGPGAPAARRGT
ncbi:MAG TPA: glycosyltransferase family 2 protein [Fimbriimonadaceae bacterium]|nr:glycosyltransferase family 2 protein [Fimbriimonadaceae bacterium]